MRIENVVSFAEKLRFWKNFKPLGSLLWHPYEFPENQ